MNTLLDRKAQDRLSRPRRTDADVRAFTKLRHGFATALIERGAPLPDVAKMCGWSRDLKTLGKLYAHVTEKSQAKTASLM